MCFSWVASIPSLRGNSNSRAALPRGSRQSGRTAPLFCRQPEPHNYFHCTGKQRCCPWENVRNTPAKHGVSCGFWHGAVRGLLIVPCGANSDSALLRACDLQNVHIQERSLCHAAGCYQSAALFYPGPDSDRRHLGRLLHAKPAFPADSHPAAPILFGTCAVFSFFAQIHIRWVCFLCYCMDHIDHRDGGMRWPIRYTDTSGYPPENKTRTGK